MAQQGRKGVACGWITFVGTELCTFHDENPALLLIPNMSGRSAGLLEQLEQSRYLELAFEDRPGLVVDREVSWRESRRLATRLKAAKLPH